MNTSIFCFIAGIIFSQDCYAITQDSLKVSDSVQAEIFLDKSEEHLKISGITDAKEKFNGFVIKPHMQADTAHEIVANLLSEANFIINPEIIDAYAAVLETTVEAKARVEHFFRADLSEGFVLFFNIVTDKLANTEIYYRIIQSHQAKLQVLKMKRTLKIKSELIESRQQSLRLIDELGNGNISFEEFEIKNHKLETQITLLEEELESF